MTETSPATPVPVPQPPATPEPALASEGAFNEDAPLLLLDVVDDDDDQPSSVTMVVDDDEFEIESYVGTLRAVATEILEESSNASPEVYAAAGPDVGAGRAAIADVDYFDGGAPAVSVEVEAATPEALYDPDYDDDSAPRQSLPYNQPDEIARAMADASFEGPILIAAPRPDLEPALTLHAGTGADFNPAALSASPVAVAERNLDVEPVIQIEPMRGHEPEELQIARRVAAIDIDRGHLYGDDDGTLYGHDIVSEMHRLTLIAEDEGAYDYEAARVARLAFAVKHGLEAVLPQYARGYGKLAAVIRGVAEDGEISDEDRDRINQIAALETDSITGPVINAPDAHVWQETFDQETLFALAVDQACYEAARVKDMNRAAAAVGIAIGEGEHDYSGARQISIAATKSAEALAKSDAEHQADELVQLMHSLSARDRVRATLALRVLLEGQNHKYAKADLAFFVVTKLSDERLAKLDPATAARLMLALQRASRSQAVTPLGRSVSLMPERSEFEGTSALESPQDARSWTAERCDGPTQSHLDAVTRLRAQGPKQMKYLQRDSSFEVRYTPRLH